MKREAGKFIGFFNLVEAMRRPGCPVCLRVVEDGRRSMEAFLYECVNDPALRDEIRRDGGFCHRHSWQLVRFGDALGGAILFRDVLASVSMPAGARRRPFSLGRREGREDDAQPCHFCRMERRTLESALTELGGRADDPELLAAWDGPAVLCVPHLSAACTRVVVPATRERLIEIHRSKYAQLGEEMTRLIDKQSYDRRAVEATADERTSWMRAVEALVGRPDARC